jgi:hypothetical protein
VVISKRPSQTPVSPGRERQGPQAAPRRLTRFAQHVDLALVGLDARAGQGGGEGLTAA